MNRLATTTALLLAALLPFSPAALALSEGMVAPDFTLPALQAPGESVILSEQRGKVVYVDFWASWCAPCRVSMPLLNELRNRLVNEGAAFEVVAVDVDSRADDGLAFLEEAAVDYVVASDTQGEVPATYELRGMPTGFLLDRDGRIRLIHTGFKSSDIEVIEREARRLLAE
ncbi:MAG TPA: TlpA disulfide reductase family protein [Hyphomicrobiales bacterium]|nr:TlpA disulfide reductase family protein [Hyphomicrobiales bacterium]